MYWDMGDGVIEREFKDGVGIKRGTSEGSGVGPRTGLDGVLGQTGLLMLSLSSPWQEDRLAGLGAKGDGVGGWDKHWELKPS